MRILSLIIPAFLLTVFASAQPGSDQQHLRYKEIKSGLIVFYADNPASYPAQLKIEFPVLKNMTPSRQDYSFTVVPAGASNMEVLRLTAQKGKMSQFRERHIFLPGDPSLKPDTKHAYVFPFKHGLKSRIGQGYYGDFSHKNLKALDFEMPIGTEICAARGGIVTDVETRYDKGGTSRDFLNKGNHIVIYHNDGTFARYGHLKKNGALVKPGQKVTAGQVIGLSGNTGYSSGPHLHFEVGAPVKGKAPQTIATKFRGPNGNTIAPTTGQTVYARHPGKPPVDTRKATATSGKGKSAKVVPGKMVIQEIKEDSGSRLIALNGMKTETFVEVRLKLKNATSEKGNPIMFSLKPGNRTEVTFIKPKNLTKPWGFSYSYQVTVKGN
ncbi:hypothetical protein FUAX_34760 [Fulvitalea axinellae]|uniref:M23ase beta-sheet core domain-containing protein n=1 Tax=Fulvitalea axinellae TaxID=1182444 RepID=A0AAU9D8Z6_9BACT|nr:hypothetical protein FUAX_34760 [Fulvitalea axinellae]